MRNSAQYFSNRAEAGQALAKVLGFYTNKPDVIVLALPRGGVPVAYEVAAQLSLPLDIWLVRKLGLPWQPEVAMGAIAPGGICHLNRDLVDRFGISDQMIAEVAKKEQAELERRDKLYRDGRPLPDLKDKTVILVDDGLATGATMRAAIESLAKMDIARIVTAIPVCEKTACHELEQVADDVICLSLPDRFCGVGQWYEDFNQISDDEVRWLLQNANRAEPKRRKLP